MTKILTHGEVLLLADAIKEYHDAIETAHNLKRYLEEQSVVVLTPRDLGLDLGEAGIIPLARGKRTSQLNIRVTPEFHDAVRDAAAAVGLSIADVLERALHIYLNQVALEKNDATHVIDEQCVAETVDGRRCRQPRTSGGKFCQRHASMRDERVVISNDRASIARCLAVTRNGTRCTRSTNSCRDHEPQDPNVHTEPETKVGK